MKTALHSFFTRAGLRVFLWLLSALSFAVHPAQAAVVEAWVHRYNNDNAVDQLDDNARAVAVDGSGNVVVTGYSSNGTDIDFYTAKYAAADGALLWEKRYDGPAHSYDEPTAIAVDGSGNVAVTGYSYNGSSFDCYTAKYAAADGAMVWEQRYNSQSSGGLAPALVVDGSGNVVVTGLVLGDFHTVKYAAATGALLWEKHYDGPAQGYDAPIAVAVDASGNVVVTGWSRNSNSNYGNDFYTAKYAAANGALLWEKRYNGPTNGEDTPAAVAVDGGGNVVVTGSSQSGITGYYTARYAAVDGALLWEKRYSGTDTYFDEAQDVAVDGTGNVVVTGISQSRLPPHDYNFHTAKYAAANGALLWEKRYDGPATDSAHAVAVDASGNVVVAGQSDGGGSSYDYYTAAYAGADGAQLWEKRYNGPANGTDYANDLALGPNGMVAITGASYGGFGHQYATVVYRALPPPVSFAAWAAGFGLSGAAAAVDADPDADGLPNAAEYISGGNPRVSNTSGRPTAAASGGNMVFTFLRDDCSETPDVTLTVESGSDLITWPNVFNIGPNTTASSLGVSITENGAALDTITVTIPQGPDTSRFVRLKVTIAQ